MIGAKFLLGHPDLETTPKGQHRYGQRSLVFPLPIAPEMKYQKEEGPSLKNCFELLRDVSSAPVIDLARLLDAVIYNYLVGNNDAHGKNFSLLYHGAGAENRGIRLAPLYDLVSTVYYPEISRGMAMGHGHEDWRRIFVGESN